MWCLNFRAFETGITVVCHRSCAFPSACGLSISGFWIVAARGHHLYFHVPAYPARPTKLTSSMLSDSRPTQPALTNMHKLSACLSRSVRVASMVVFEGLTARRCLTFSIRLELVCSQQHDEAGKAIVCVTVGNPWFQRNPLALRVRLLRNVGMWSIEDHRSF